MPSLRITARWALMALPRRVLVRQLKENADELAELRDARCLLQREVNSLRRELAQAETELIIYSRIEDSRGS